MSIPAQGAVGAGQSYQERVRQHFLYVAGDDTTDMPERRDRACEEFAELQQALGGTLEGWIAVGRYVWGRPIGEPAQEMGGTLNTLAALAAWADLDMMACAEAELERTKQPEIVAKIRRKRANRHGRGVLPGNDADLVTAALASPRADSDERTAGEDLKIAEATREVVRSAWNLCDRTDDGDADDPTPRFEAEDLHALMKSITDLEALIPAAEQPAQAGHAVTLLIEALRATPAQPAGAVPDSLRDVLMHACYGVHDEPDLNRKSVRISCLNEDGALAVRNWLLDLRDGISTHLPGRNAETDALVDRFAVALKVKLRAAEAKYDWQNGWLKDDWKVKCQHDLLRHVGKGDPLDVAAYAAFCWHHGWPTASQRSTEFVTGAVEPTAAAIAAYTARYPDGTLSETSDNAIECWNRVAVAACLAGQSIRQGVDLQKTLTLIRDFAGSSILLRNDALDHIYVVASKALDPSSPVPEPADKPDSASDGLREALEFYADRANWRDTPPWDGDPECITEKAIPVNAAEPGSPCDCGDVARAALKALASHPAGQSAGSGAEDADLQRVKDAARDLRERHGGNGWDAKAAADNRDRSKGDKRAFWQAVHDHITARQSI